MLTPQHRAIAQTIADRFSQLEAVQAVCVAGSTATGNSSPTSDIDLYVYHLEDIPTETRLAIAREFTDHPALNDYRGAGLDWDDPESGIQVDLMFFQANWMIEQISRVLVRHEALMGYTTCFWHTVRVSQILFDRNQWFARLQEKASVPYPDALAWNIVSHNFPVLRDIRSAYRVQIEKAVRRGDVISINHRIAEMLASYFDIIFALNRLPHPGEKRLLDIVEASCSLYPLHMREQITKLLQTAFTAPAEDITAQVDRLVADLEQLIPPEWLSSGDI